MRAVPCFITFLLVLSCALAQADIAGILARQPGNTPEEAAQNAKDLAALGAEAVAEVAAQLVPLGEGDDAAVRYALSGLAKYGSAPGNEAVRTAAVEGMLKGLEGTDNAEVQTFLIERLQWVADDRAVPALAKLLEEDAPYDAAARALQSIGSEAACTALARALWPNVVMCTTTGCIVVPPAEGARAVTLLSALGSAACPDAAEDILHFATHTDASVQQAAFHALASLGVADAAKMMAEAEMHDTSLRVARALLEQQDHKAAARISQSVYRNTAEEDPEHTAALTLLAKARGDRAIGTLRGALKSDSHEVRAAAIRALAEMDSPRSASALKRVLKTRNEVLLAELLHILGTSGVDAALPAAQEHLTHPDLGVRLAAIQALVFLEGRDAFDLLFARRSDLPTTNDVETVALDKALDQTRAPLGAPLGTADDEGYVPIFNGQDLSGWLGDTEGYVVEDEAIVWKDGRKLYTLGDYGDFSLRFEYRVAPEANNGIGIRMPLGSHAATQGMEIQILDDNAAKYADLQPYQYCGAIYGVAAPERGHTKPAGEWNAMEITAKGSQVTVIINGHTVVDVDVAAIHAEGTPDEKEHPGLLRKTGRLALLGHGTEVAYRKLRVKPL